jgi:RNA polymerase sigma-70 factor (ECF subfamily)
MSDENDAKVVAACLSGEKRAFEMLVEKYHKTLFNTAYRVINDFEEASDATQSAFVKAYEKLDNFNPRYRFFSWIYRILLNESLNRLSELKRRNSLDSDVLMTSRNPEDTYTESETDRHVQSALMDIKADYRVVIVLRHFQDLSYRQMGSILGIPEKTVKSRLFTARRQLRDVLMKRGIVG